jgi:glutamine synthetase
MVIGALVNAGLAGIREKLPLPPAVDRDPAELSDAERAQLGIVTLPSSLDEALNALDADEVARSWLSPVFYQAYTAVKRMEISMFADETPEHMCERYQNAY